MLVLNPGQEKSILMLDPDSKNNLLGDAATDELLRKGYTVVLADLRGTEKPGGRPPPSRCKTARTLSSGKAALISACGTASCSTPP